MNEDVFHPLATRVIQLYQGNGFIAPALSTPIFSVNRVLNSFGHRSHALGNTVFIAVADF